MPITFRIDHARRLVVACGWGTLSDTEAFEYQREAWTRPDVAGYDELVDVSAVERFAVPSANRVADLAAFSASLDCPTRGARLAIVAPQDIAFGLGRMFASFRDTEPRSTREVCVFRTLREALVFLGITNLSAVEHGLAL